MNSIKITLISLFITSSSYAEEILKFVSIDSCKAYYAKSVTPVAGETPDTYCKNRIMGFVEACTASEIAAYLKAANIKSFSDLTDTEQRKKKADFSYKCQVMAQNESAGNAQIAAQARAASGVTGATTSQQKAAIEAQQFGALAQAGVKAYADKYGDPKKELRDTAKNMLGKSDKTEGAKAAAQSSEQSQASGTSSGQASSSASAPATAPTQNESAGLESGVKENASTTNQPDMAGSDPSASDPKAVAIDTQNAAKQVPTATKAAGEVDPKLEAPAKSVNDAVSAADKTPQGLATSITTEADAISTKLTSGMQTSVTNAQQQLGVGLPQTNYPQTIAMVNSIRAEVTSYTTSMKKICSRSAEAAYYLCLESPVAASAKKFMDGAGVVLAGISSAQKTCSATSKVTNAVGLALTVAKGACVASKLTCDLSCAKAVSDVGRIILKAKTELKSVAWEESAYNAVSCMSLTVGAAACEADNDRKLTAALGISESIATLLATETNAATKGTSPSIVAGCKGYSKEVALFGAQVLGAFAAKKSAQACEEKLAASGSGGTNVSTQQYCDKSENSSTQLCICQKNSMAPGCPGAVLADSAATTNSSSDKGTNIKNLSGNSAFAGFGSGSAKSADAANKNLSKDSINGALMGGSAASTSAAGSGMGDAGGSGFSGGGSGAGGGLGSPTGSSADAAKGAKKAAEGENKKWSFGAFQSDSSSSGLGGYGSGSGSNKYKSGALTNGDQAAIQRQIASEKYAAEVSTASGKSNWEKIRNMYLIKENSFIFGQ